MSRRFLYICTHNRCRSILAEAITNHLAKGRVQAASAGSQPVDEVHPLSLKFLRERGIPTDGLRSQSWLDFQTFEPHLIITLCDQAASEPCPVWFDQSLRLHWSLEDPSRIIGIDGAAASGGEIRAAFYHTIDIIEQRVRQLLEHDIRNPGDAEFSRAVAS